MRGVLFRALCVLLPLYGLYEAARMSWVCDDAFISFRYARNFARGLGMVFNAGEHVEGYTNFLWTALLVPVLWLGGDPVLYSRIFGVLCFAALLAFVFFRGGEFAGAKGGGFRAVPWTLPALATHFHMQIFATSGLETSLFTLLLTSGVLLVWRGDSGAGLSLLVLACLTRPDGFVVYAVCAVFVLVSRGFWDWVRSNAAFLLVFLPYWAFRWWYFGQFFPNTFYAKSAYEAHVWRGLGYAWLYFGSYWVFAASLVLPALFLSANRRFARDLRAMLVPGVVFFWVCYVVWVGGDFMFARFLIPVSPLLFLLGERMVRSAFPGLSEGVGLALFAAATLLRIDPYAGGVPERWGVVYEHRVYPLASVRAIGREAERLSEAMRRAAPVVAFRGGGAFVAYYLDVPEAIEAETGLTDEFIASSRPSAGGRAGHEKRASVDYLRRRGVSFILHPPPPERSRGFNTIRLGGLPVVAEILTYRPSVMEVLGSDGRFVFVDFEEFLHAYLRESPNMGKEDLDFFRTYYEGDLDAILSGPGSAGQE